MAILAVLHQPGLLGWGRDGCRVEILRSGSWFHWKVTRSETPPSEQAVARPDVSNIIYADKGPELPWEIRRFWPAEESKDKDVESASTE